MSKLKLTKPKEAIAIARVICMCHHSLPPKELEELERITAMLVNNRHIDPKLVELEHKWLNP